MSLTLVTAPPVQPVTLAELKAQLRIDTSDEDALLAALIEAATAHLDGDRGVLGRALIEQTWDYRIDDFPDDDRAIRLPLPPLREVVSVNYLASDGAETLLAASEYTVHANGTGHALIEPAYGKTWPVTRDRMRAVTIRLRVGYAASADSPTDYRASVPMPIRQAVLLLASHWFETRTPVVIGKTATEIPGTLEALVAPYRVFFRADTVRRPFRSRRL